ncbi:MAG TPA: hypothetical protein DC058_11070 [Planctomycetaceae bacterium]|nr:hypothetical protein [Planctomycetaceae bacterium]
MSWAAGIYQKTCASPCPAGAGYGQQSGATGVLDPFHINLTGPDHGATIMSTNTPEQQSANLLKNILEDVWLDKIEDELEQEHPVDSELFLDALTAGRLGAPQLQEFRQHLRGCLLCSEVVSDLRTVYTMPWLPSDLAEDSEAEGMSAAELSTAAAPPVQAGAEFLQQAREQLSMRSRPAASGAGRRLGLGRTVAVVAGMAAALLLLVPGLRTLVQPAVTPSAFATLATLADFGLGQGPAGSRDLTEEGRQQIQQQRTVLERIPTDPTARLNLAATLLQNRQLDEARTLIQAVLQIRPQDPQVLNALALVQVASDEPRTAILTLQQAVAISPLFAPAALNLAVLLNDQGRPEEARAVLSEALQSVLSDGDRLRLQQQLDGLKPNR